MSYSTRTQSNYRHPRVRQQTRHKIHVRACVMQTPYKTSFIYVQNIHMCLYFCYRSNGLKVYYLPLTVVYDQIVFPTLFSFLPLFRNILIREKIQIIHGHQSVSTLAHECILYARTMVRSSLHSFYYCFMYIG